MPIYAYQNPVTGAEFHREVADYPPEMWELRHVAELEERAGCPCAGCTTLRRYTPEQLNLARDIRQAQADAVRDLEAFQAVHQPAGQRCTACSYRSRNAAEFRQVECAEGELTLCDYCATELRSCDGCERVTSNRRMFHGDSRYCTGCVDVESMCWCGYFYDAFSGEPCRAPRGQIHSYSYRPELVFHTLGDGTDTVMVKGADRTPYMGFELEVTFDDDYVSAAGTVTDIIGDLAYLKEDGSVSDGFEMVTHPMTLRYASERFPWEVLAAMRAAGGGTNRGLGLHVHVSKAAFASPAHEYRWLLFWHRNSRVMSTLARRDNTDWAAWTNSARRSAKAVAQKKSDGRDVGRYQAINTINEDTHEVRIFRSSLNRQEIMGALALVSGTVEYSRQLDANGVLKASGWEFDTFAAWAAKQPVYGDLTAEITRHFPNGTADVRAPRAPQRTRPVDDWVDPVATPVNWFTVDIPTSSERNA